MQLYEEIEKESIEGVKQLLIKYPKLINEPFSDGSVFNPVIRASWRGDYKMIEILKEYGADLDLSGI